MPASSALTASIARLGQLQPILVDAQGQVIDGGSRLSSCQELGIEPWLHTVTSDPGEVRLHTLIRRTPSPVEVAEMAVRLRAKLSPSGARRAHGTGKTQDVVAAAMAELYGVDVSPREVSYALALGQAEPSEVAAIAAAAPTSMRAAHRVLQAHRLGATSDPNNPPAIDRTELAKTAFEFKAAVLRRTGTLSAADRAVLADLRAAIDRTLAEGDHAAA